MSLVVGAVLFEGVRSALVVTNNLNFAPALILLGAATTPFAFVLFVAAHGRHVGTSAVLLAGTAVVGGAVGVITAGLVEYETLVRLGTLPVLVVALAEEVAKMLVPAAVLLASRRRCGPGAALALGVAAGAGFAALETMGYATTTLVRSHDDLAAVDATLLHRGLLSPAAHMAWTGLTATALGHAIAHRWTARATSMFVVTVTGAVGLHTAWDGIGTVAAYVVLATVSLALLLAVAARVTAGPGGSPRSRWGTLGT